jgi:hypothetical protein
MKISNILGIDVSKSTLDCHLHLQKQQLDAIPNTSQGHKQIGKWLKKQCKGGMSEVLVVMEHTGIYTFGLEQYLYKEGIAYVKRPALDIKRSLGMIRGKTDKADARFISKYGWMRREECGVAPFKHESGTSIRGKTRVSHLANKKLKCLLTMAAICAVQWDEDLKRKYEQKIKEGKPKMSVLNIIRAKLIERMFAVVKRQSKYEIRAAA